MQLTQTVAGALTLLAISCSGQTSLCASEIKLSFSEVQKRSLTLPIFSFSGLPVSDAGAVYSLTSEQREVRGLTLRDGRVRRLRLRALPPEISQWQLGPEVAADRRGCLYVAGHNRQSSLREEPSSSLFGVVVFLPDGRYNFTIHPTPAVDIRHIAVDEIGDLYVLGIDLASLYHPLSPCLLVYKYSRQGVRLAAFSDCPAAELARTADEHAGQLFFRREQTARGSQVLLRGGFLYHVLFSPQIMRIFDTRGRLAPCELHLEPLSASVLLSPSGMPNPANTNDEVTQVVVLRGGGFLVEWAHSELFESGVRKLLYLGVHDARGRALSQPGTAPVARSMLMHVDENDYVYFLGMPASGRQELIRARISLR